MFFLLIFLVQGMDITKIPSTGNPPNRRFLTSTAIDKALNRLISFGGFDTVLQSYVSSLITFDLNTNSWGEIFPESLIIPQSSMATIVYIRSDRKMLLLFGENDSGISSGVYTFDLTTYYYRIEYLLGDPILGRTHSASTSFTYLNASYLALFGGVTRNGVENDLYL